MTVYLKGLGTHLDQVEKDVQSIKVTDKHIVIRYEPLSQYHHPLVTGVTYYADEMKIERVEA